jgi:poly-gamma-glutamate synthase PgsB/CapB
LTRRLRPADLRLALAAANACMNGIILLAVITAGLVALGVAESLAHRRRLARIPIRIHVNGTRGKSSVTRLIAAGLREGGVITCAKTTGTLPRMIMPNATEYPVFRPSGPNVIEQIRVVRAAASYPAEALVIECMALQPNLQWLCESRFVRATHGVITNAREDHLDVMGPSETDVAWALAGMTPLRGALFTAERRHPDIFKQAADDRGSRFVPTKSDDVTRITAQELSQFSYVEHAENVALALKVCEDIGIDRATALRGMSKAKPDPGAMTDHQIDFFGRKLYFVNGFAANDPESTERIWNMAIQRYADVEKRIAVFNCRADRADRSGQLGRACATWPAADHYVLIGTGTYLFARAASDASLDMQKVVFVENRRVDEIFEAIVELVGKSALVMGMGNIGGPGLDVVRFFRNRSVVAAEAAPV